MNIVFDNSVSIVISDLWQRLNAMPEDPPGSQSFCIITDYCKCFIIAYPIGVQNTMPFKNPQEIIDGIHGALADDQALIEVKSDCTKKFGIIYSIIKTKKQPSGVQYTLTMDVATQYEAVHIQGFFDEAGITGQRDAIVFELERRNGNVTDNFESWMADPYDDNYQREYLMNLSEREEYDKMFPQHPLSIARVFTRELSISNI